MAKKNTTIYFEGITELSVLNQKLIDYMTNTEISEKTLDAINKEYDALYIVLKEEFNKQAEEYKKVYGTPTSTREAIKLIIDYKDVAKDLDLMRDCDVMMVGTWVWVKGKADKDPEITRQYRPFFKSVKGFHWNSERGVWQWHYDEGKPWIPYHRGKGVKLPDEDGVFKKYGLKYVTTGDEA